VPAHTADLRHIADAQKLRAINIQHWKARVGIRQQLPVSWIGSWSFAGK
jgi:hypothetical protein